MPLLLLAVLIATLVSLLAAANCFASGKSKLAGSFCADDWCMNIESVHKTPASDGNTYRFGFRPFSHALRTPQSAAGASVYLTDQRSRLQPASP